ncbi:MAG: 3-methyl-2-oxobutanoate hydroxymethyltransferase [Candidatus Omnitrophica bacterium]|nr:3-methyl-2-oxobutanoate hydroxymethyltransferase [Candidatus Omnitrophota bacterium]
MKITTKEIYRKKNKEKIAVLTAYDYPFARILDEEGIDIILVGDSLGMVMLGYDTTLPVTMEDMLHHTKAVSRAVKTALVVADMPYRSYQTPAQALKNARRFLNEGGADAVKLEGGVKVKAQVKLLIQKKIPVMGHVGMTPQSVKEFGGYRVQGKDPLRAAEIYKDAVLLDDLGIFSLVLECIPSGLAETITKKIKCPTIGIGAGPKTDGQVLVLHDMLGIESKVHPRFVRRYAALEKITRGAVSHYKRDIRRGKFPSRKESY